MFQCERVLNGWRENKGRPLQVRRWSFTLPLDLGERERGNAKRNDRRQIWERLSRLLAPWGTAAGILLCTQRGMLTNALFQINFWIFIIILRKIIKMKNNIWPMDSSLHYECPINIIKVWENRAQNVLQYKLPMSDEFLNWLLIDSF